MFTTRLRLVGTKYMHMFITVITYIHVGMLTHLGSKHRTGSNARVQSY